MKDYSQSEFNIQKAPQKALNALLSKDEFTIIPALNDFKDDGFVLYGSLATTLQLQHRHAKSFDFFTDATIPTEELEKNLREKYTFLSDAELIKKDDRMLVLETKKGIIFSFFTQISTGRVGEPLLYKGMKLASLADLFAYKINKLAKRTRISDYQDVAALIGAGQSIEHAFANAKALFGDDFAVEETIQAISNFVVSQNFMELSSIMKENIIASLINLDKVNEQLTQTETTAENAVENVAENAAEEADEKAEKQNLAGIILSPTIS